MTAPETAPGQAAPVSFARWWRLEQPNMPDEELADMWRVSTPADRAFWTEIDAAIAAQERPAPELVPSGQLLSDYLRERGNTYAADLVEDAERRMRPGAAPHWLVTDFDSYWKAQGYNPDRSLVCSNFGPDDLRDAFEAGRQAARDLAAQERPAPELADAVAKSDRLEGQNEDLRRQLTALRDGIAALADEMHAEAQVIAPASSEPDGMPDMADQVRAEVLHEYAGRILALLEGK